MFCKNCGQQVKAGSKFCKNCGQEIKFGRFAIFRVNFFGWLKDHRKGFLIALGIVVFIAILGIYDESSNTNTSSNYSATQTISYDQNEIVASVVNIFCPSTVSEEEASGGSGTIISEDGLILTNSHIIPQDEINIHVDEQGCLVVLPDPTTGQAKDIYLAHPIVLPELSDKYDLAFMEIYSSYYDVETGEYSSVYPRKFPSFDDTTRCNNENIQLGEPIRIFGYPAISGGYSLTITDGVVSSFPGDSLIVTSAKISYGNSGGLAVDRNGCMIGVPSMVSSDEVESLGVIISMDLVNQFSEEVTTYIDSLK
ncbi:trypsin-like peptidase domain-containing protein [Candidatus Parcubacteria bacterium]|nr:trypsin-like peptidase domain-containing protein [Patescibacteria group bacterium]MBU4380767.1 trypsin-like peptidase domain-containing protein [Patescibacteria group bacterium]MCG2688849.1 trypsin-like peptidase domain-containing protein [Candidatus Parcubacteria bacterium]